MRDGLSEFKLLQIKKPVRFSFLNRLSENDISGGYYRALMALSAASHRLPK